jgi:uncharacterized protein YndB with AHSA1/START domain
MAVFEFEVERTVNAPIDQVFARLADIDRYGEWMPKKGSMLKSTEKTSPGEPGLGTTFLDDTTYGATPGEIVEFQPPTRLVFHWWDRAKSGKTKVEGWPGYTLTAQDAGTTLVVHDAKLQAHGMYRLAGPVFRRLAVKERTVTLEALQASFA